ncbi:MAG: choice-of-anchor D domain-containing protein [Bacteroidetes bacterium]|nr:choice-of-anchor D domain-containing protein [Bacteroidota bacterium]
MDGDLTPSTTDFTDFGTPFPGVPVVHTFVIENNGNAPLTVSTISLSGPQAANFAVGGITLPVTLAPGGTTTFTVTFAANPLGIYNAFVVINNSDCNENPYDFAVKGEVSCQPAAFSTCPTNQVVNTASNLCTQVVNYSPVITGAPSPTVSYTFTGATTASGAGTGSGSVFNLGTTTVTLTASNVCGSSTCTFTVVVNDLQAPNAICQNVTVQLNNAGNGSIVASMVNNGSNDACGILGVAVNPTTFNCSNVSPAPLTELFISEYVEGSGTNKYIELYNPTSSPINLANYELRLFSNGSPVGSPANTLSGTLAAGGTVVYRNGTATIYAGSSTIQTAVNWNGDDAIGVFNTLTNQFADIFGRIGDDPGTAWTATGTSTLDRTLRRKPTVTRGVTTSPTGTGPSAFTTLATEWDAFAVDNVVGLGSHAFIAPNTAILTVTDINGNTSTCSASVTVEDNIAPIALCQNVTVQLNNSGVGLTTATAVNNGSSDACGIASTTLSTSNFTCLNLGPNPLVLTVTDVNGNSSTCNAVATVVDLIPPVITCQNVTVALDGNGQVIMPLPPSNVPTDNCQIVSFTASQTTFGCANVGPNTVVVTVTDQSGNSTSCTGIVTVVDPVAPIAVCQNVTVQLDNTGNGSTTAAAVNNGSSDNCAIATLALSQTAFVCSEVGANTEVLTVTDVNGNSTTCSTTITVEDNVAPVAVCQNITVQLDPSGNAASLLRR